MGGTASSAFLMSFQKYPVCSLVTWATFLNLLSLLWPTRSPHTSLLLALGRITLRLTLTSTLALYCTSQVQSPLLKYLVMKKRIRRMSSCLKDAFLFFSSYALRSISSFVIFQLFLCIYSKIFKMPGRQCWIFHMVTCCEIYAGVGWISWLQVWVFTHFSSLFFSICSTIATQCAYDVSKGWVQRLQSYINFSRKWAHRGYRYEFSFVFFHSFFSIYSTIATQCAYKVLKGWVQRFWSYINFSRKWADRGYRYEFSLIFLHFFLIHSTIATKCA